MIGQGIGSTPCRVCGFGPEHHVALDRRHDYEPTISLPAPTKILYQGPGKPGKVYPSVPTRRHR